ncbi:MAG: cyclic pyranopterin monophosphate synthase MoaC, partial [Planctomycetota bacterium]
MSRNRDPARLSHVDEQGRARMVDVGGKETTRRRAVASGRIRMSPATLAAIRDGAASKGDVLAVARIAAIQAGKEASRWIPLCHPIPLDAIDVDLGLEEQPAGSSAEVRVRVEVRSRGRTG